MDERAAFERAIDTNPLEASNHLVYADWLDENARTDEDRLEAQFRRRLGNWIASKALKHDPNNHRPWVFNLGVGGISTAMDRGKV